MKRALLSVTIYLALLVAAYAYAGTGSHYDSTGSSGGGGGGVASLTPWTGDIDGDGFDLTDVGDVAVQSAGSYSWSGRSVLRSDANAQLELLNSAGTAGLKLKWTDGALSLRNRADAANASLALSTLTADAVNTPTVLGFTTDLGASITASTTDDYIWRYRATLNDVTAAGGSDTFRAQKIMLTTTNVNGFNQIYFVDYTDDGTSKFTVDWSGSVVAQANISGSAIGAIATTGFRWTSGVAGSSYTNMAYDIVRGAPYLTNNNSFGFAAGDIAASMKGPCWYSGTQNTSNYDVCIVRPNTANTVLIATNQGVTTRGNLQVGAIDATGVTALTGGATLPVQTAAAPAAPATCNAAAKGRLEVVDDNNDSAGTQLCYCGMTDDSTYDWLKVIDNTACTHY